MKARYQQHGWAELPTTKNRKQIFRLFLVFVIAMVAYNSLLFSADNKLFVKETAECLRSRMKTKSEIFATNFKEYTSNSGSNGYDYKKNDSPAEDLKVAWLMSFPNSGTSYTLSLVKEASNRLTASNYCNRNGKRRGNVLEDIFDSDENGPRVTVGKHQRSLPEKYIFTKTHCGGYCSFDCPPTEYVLSRERFQYECQSGCYAQKRNEPSVHYGTSLVGKAVHLIRDPFDNIISRFNCQKKNHDEKYAEYPKSAEGFQAWCSVQDEQFEEEKALFGEAISAASKGVPCRADFFKYIQWHNHAFETRRSMNLNTHVMFYEDYDDDFDSTLAKVLQFLELPHENREVGIFHRNNYSNFYSKEQYLATEAFMKELASEDTWVALKKRYGFSL